MKSDNSEYIVITLTERFAKAAGSDVNGFAWWPLTEQLQPVSGQIVAPDCLVNDMADDMKRQADELGSDSIPGVLADLMANFLRAASEKIVSSREKDENPVYLVEVPREKADEAVKILRSPAAAPYVTMAVYRARGVW